MNVGDERLMFDCGPASTHKLVKMGIPLTKIDNLFFTHHHFDHDVDYPCFILSPLEPLPSAANATCGCTART